MKAIMIFIALVCTLVSCHDIWPEHVTYSESQSDSFLHARNFSIQHIGNLKLLSIHAAWKGGNTMQYLLYPKGDSIPTLYPNAQKIAVPVQRILCTSTVDVAFLDFLGATDRIVAMANADYLYNPSVKKGLQEQSIVDLGSYGAIDFEKALIAAPDLALTYSLGDMKNYKKLKELGIPTVLLADFMENTPLGRAEWSVFVAYLLGLEAEATDRFKIVEQSYQALKNKADSLQNLPSVLTGAVFQGTWHVAGGQSLMATLIKDAHGHYLWQDNKDVSGVPLDIEAVYAKALKADYWINMSHHQNKSAMLQTEPLYADFSAFQKGNLFNYYKRSTANGGTDVFESAIVAPHRLLSDMIQILHSHPVDSSSLYYYTQLSD